MRDPFVEEVRKFRMEHTKEHHSDLHRIGEDLRQFESSLGDRVVTLKPREVKPAGKSNRTE